MKKRIVSLLLAAAMAALLAVPAFAAEDDGIKLTVDGQAYEFDAAYGAPYADSESSRVLFPLRSAAYALGMTEADVAWDQDTLTACLTLNGRTVAFTVDCPYAVITEDGETSYMRLDAVPAIRNERIYLPIRFLAVAFGYSAAWDGSTNTVALATREEDAPVATIFLTRHGKTMFNTAKRVQGWCDTPLTEAGAKVAADLGKGLKASGVTFIAAYSSDLGRQRETARLVLDQLGLEDMAITELFGLRETCFGSWEGELESVRDAAYCEIAGTHSIYEIYEAGGTLFNDITVETDTTGQAESLEQVQSRMLSALTRIAEETIAAGGGNVLAVSSGGITSSLIQMFNGDGANLANASVTTLVYTDGVFILTGIGDTSYSELGATVE